MLRTHVADALRPIDAEVKVTLAGWVGNRRDHGGVAFIDLRDASGIVQVVCLLYTSPSPRDLSTSRMPSSA